MKTKTPAHRLKTLFVGKARDIAEEGLFHKMSLVAVLAWVGLGADGLSSSCYGPEETMKALVAHPSLALFVALATVITIGVICASYSQIISVFPGGGGGYVVASKLLSPAAGVTSGCALLVDYVLTIALSVAAGADALFSVLPASWIHWKLATALGATLILIVLNLRGVKESVMVWAPIFFVFLGTHGFMILYGFFDHVGNLPEILRTTGSDLTASHKELGGWWGVGALLLTAYSLGAGSYTGIEAVSNGLGVLREPRVATGRRTMLYMGLSLAFMVGGLLLMYLLYKAMPHEGMTLNAILFGKITASWPSGLSSGFVWIAMFSAAALLFIAAQTGFLDGPRVLSNMALDRWVPARFASLSDRFVARNGIVIMGLSALLLIWVSNGSVDWLVVLYSINVFITFSLSQLGMVRHWWNHRRSEPSWRSKLAVNALGFLLTATILVALSAIKFHQGGWITLVVTGSLVAVAFLIKRHYQGVARELGRLEALKEAVAVPEGAVLPSPAPLDPKARTAVLFVNGFNGLGIHTLLGIQRMFPGMFTNFVFAEIGVVDAGNFKGSEEIGNLRTSVDRETRRYVDYMQHHGFRAEAVHRIGTEVVATALELGEEIRTRHPEAVFFGGQLVFEEENLATKLLHNFTVFAMQRDFYREGMPFFILPVRV
jgi:amino acid transporter